MLKVLKKLFLREINFRGYLGLLIAHVTFENSLIQDDGFKMTILRQRIKMLQMLKTMFLLVVDYLEVFRVADYKF